MSINSKTSHGRGIDLKRVEIIVFTIVTGLLATFRVRYIYGLVNQIEHLPPVFRLIDPRLYPTDWHVAQNLVYGPRFFYYHMLAALGEVFPLPAVMFVGTVLCNIATLYITFLLGRRLFRDDLTAMLGVVLVAGIHSIDLGGATFLTWEYLVQASIAEPLAMAAILMALNLRPVSATLLAAVASVLHPVVGLETGGLALGVVAADALVYRREPGALRRALAAIGGVVFLALLAYAVFLGPADRSLSDRQFFDILVHFRNPHHYVPTAMPARDFWMFGFFLLATVVAWWTWYRSVETDRRLAIRVATLIGYVLGVMLIGYVFVELVPLRTVASMQLFRNVFIIKWVGLVLVAFPIAGWLRENTGSRILALAALFGTGIYQPVVMAAAQLAGAVRRHTGELVSAAVAVIVWAGVAWFFGFKGREALFLFLLLLVAGWFWLARPGLTRWVAPLAAAMVLIPLALALRNQVPFLREMAYLTLEDADDPLDPVAVFARERLPLDATVVVPPRAGRFRVVSERAIVVDFKAFVFQDSSVAGWMERMTFVYGPTDKSSFAASNDLENRYKAISDEKLAAVRTRYDATHALLYRETPTRYPVVYEDTRYKLVQLPQIDARTAPGS